MFSVAYIRQHRSNNKDINSWSSKTLKCILVGKCPKSDALIFHHPPSKQTLTCGDGYRFNVYSPAGPQFNQTYDGDFEFTTKSALHNIHSRPSHKLGTTAYININNTYKKVNVLDIPTNEEDDTYTVQEIETGDIHQLYHNEIYDNNPEQDPLIDQQSQNPTFPLYPWLKHNAKTTLFLPQLMAKLKQGIIVKENNEWAFIPGRTRKGDKIELPKFDLLHESLIHNKKLCKGWVNTSTMIAARQARMTSNVLARMIKLRKVSAANLRNLEAPTLLQHHKLHPEDKKTWDESYAQEYHRLESIDTWEWISEQEYNDCKHIFGKLLPTMAISVIKNDENGLPVRAKYRIVVLSNLDPHNWTKNDVFAPVLSQMELRLLVALAVRHRKTLKSGDIVQAFCQSYLPPGKNYVCWPPAGCPITPPNTYLKLRKTLYGLKRSPRHFYELASKILESIGMKKHPYSPCIFFGTPIQGKPPLYLRLYVDDFIYFSEDNEVEK